MNPVTATFLEHGLLGACVVVLGIAVWLLYNAYAKIQTARVTEAQAVTDKLLEVTERWLTAVSATTAEIKGLGEKCESIEKRVCEVSTAIQANDLAARDRGARKGR